MILFSLKKSVIKLLNALVQVGTRNRIVIAPFICIIYFTSFFSCVCVDCSVDPESE